MPHVGMSTEQVWRVILFDGYGASPVAARVVTSEVDLSPVKVTPETLKTATTPCSAQSSMGQTNLDRRLQAAPPAALCEETTNNPPVG